MYREEGNSSPKPVYVWNRLTPDQMLRTRCWCNLFLRTFYFCFDPWLLTTTIWDTYIFQDATLCIDQWILFAWVRASWIKLNNCPTRCDCIQFITYLQTALHVSGCLHLSSGAGTTVITASGTGQPGLLPSALVVELERERMVVANSTARADGSRPGWPVSEAVITVVRAPDDGCQHPKHVELSADM